MANAMYTKGLEAFLTGKINWESDTIRAVLIDSDQYTPNLHAHQALKDIPVTARVSVSAALTAKTATNGVADAGDVAFRSVSGPESDAIVLYKDTGSEETSNLICVIDTAGGLPVSPGGSDITVVWDNGLNKIFRL